MSRLFVLSILALISCFLLISSCHGFVGGGLHDVKGQDEKVLSLLKYVKKSLATTNKSPVKILKVLSVKSQVVAGILYHLKLKIETNGKVQVINTKVLETLPNELGLSKFELKGVEKVEKVEHEL
ncbi:hypothetical protein ABK040_007282 [Willaertia magna]